MTARSPMQAEQTVANRPPPSLEPALSSRPSPASTQMLVLDGQKHQLAFWERVDELGQVGEVPSDELTTFDV